MFSNPSADVGESQLSWQYCLPLSLGLGIRHQARKEARLPGMEAAEGILSGWEVIILILIGLVPTGCEIEDLKKSKAKKFFVIIRVQGNPQAFLLSPPLLFLLPNFQLYQNL